jgi:hypothetical protein
MTEEHKKEIKKIRRRTFIRGALICSAYVLWLFTSNLLITITNALYFKDEGYMFLMTLGSTVIILTGLRGTLEELFTKAAAETKAIADKMEE